MPNTKRESATLFLVIAVICGVVLALNYNKPGEYQQQWVDAVSAGEDEAQVDEYQRQEQEATWLNVIAGLGALVSSIVSLMFGADSLQQRDKEKADLEERRHQELLAAARQANSPRPPTPEPQLNSSMDDPDYQYILKAEKLYRAGKADEAIEMLKLSNSPKAKKVLKNLQEIKKEKRM